MILDEWRNRVISAKEAIEKFKNVGIAFDSDFSEYLPEVAELIKKIISEGTVIVPLTKSKDKNAK